MLTVRVDGKTSQNASNAGMLWGPRLMRSELPAKLTRRRAGRKDWQSAWDFVQIGSEDLQQDGDVALSDTFTKTVVHCVVWSGVMSSSVLSCVGPLFQVAINLVRGTNPIIGAKLTVRSIFLVKCKQSLQTWNATTMSYPN